MNISFSGAIVSVITWLHLSDLHFNTESQTEWDMYVVLSELLNDLKDCMESKQLSPDIILFSGDIACNGKREEYELAKTFFDKLLNLLKIPKEYFFIVPGNHDVDISKVDPITVDKIGSIKETKEVNEVLDDSRIRQLTLNKFEHFFKFVNDYFEKNIFLSQDNYFYIGKIKIKDTKIAVLGLNSAWAFIDKDNSRGKLLLGEKQVRQALNGLKNEHLCIALIHHPLDWLHEFDYDICGRLLSEKCDFIIRGHLHRTEFLKNETPDSCAVTIAAGSIFSTRSYDNAYNIVSFDPDNGHGNIWLRKWSNLGKFWSADTLSYRNVNDGRFAFSINESLSPHLPAKHFADSLIEKVNFQTDNVLRYVTDTVSGMPEPLQRFEIPLIEEQILAGKNVIFTGEAGTGKSAIAGILTKSGRQKGIITLLLDARKIGHIQDEAQLCSYLNINGPFHIAVENVLINSRFRIIIDQFENILEAPSAEILKNLMIQIKGQKNSEIIIMSRKSDLRRSYLYNALTSSGFVELTCNPLTREASKDCLVLIGFNNPNEEAISLGCNLLNLQIISDILKQDPNFKFSIKMNDVILWEKYRQILLEREEIARGRHNSESMLAEAVRLSKEGLNSMDHEFILDYPHNSSQERLESCGIIVCDARIGQFRYEKFQDYIYAWDATQRKLMPKQILEEIKKHKSRNIIVLMQKIYKSQDMSLYSKFIKEAL